MDAATWANLIAGAALLGTISGWISNQRQARGAVTSAESAESEARRAGDALERIAKAMEAREKAAERHAPRPAVVWAMAKRGDGFDLVNEGRAVAYDVKVTAPEGVYINGPGIADLNPGESRYFATFVSIAASSDVLKVTWADVPGGINRDTWTRSLPR